MKDDAEKTTKIREDGMRYRIPIWQKKKHMGPTSHSAGDEVMKLANCAERNRSKKLMMLQMPEEEDREDSMRTLTRI